MLYILFLLLILTILLFVLKVNSNSVGVANGVASLDGDAKLPSSQLPSSISEDLTYTNNFKFITTKYDFPTASEGVITLLDNLTYFITADIDLTGDRLVSGSDTTILGGSSENSTLTSTGLGVGVPLLTIEYTTPIRNISFVDVDTAFSSNGNTRLIALDWSGVNFVNVPNIGTINTSDNFTFTSGAFLNSGGMSFTGTIGTVAFNQCFFNPDTAKTVFDLQAGLSITRRFRIIYSSFHVLAGETGININGSATIPVEGFILDTCNFSGGGTYLNGINSQSNNSLLNNNIGINNSSETSEYFMVGNTTATVVAVQGDLYKVLGTTTSGNFVSKFTNTNNRATYTGAITKTFYIGATMSLTSGNNNQIGVYIAKNGSVITSSEIYMTTNASGRAESGAVQCTTSLATNDYIEIFVENDSGTTDITVTEINVIIR